MKTKNLNITCEKGKGVFFIQTSGGSEWVGSGLVVGW
jgi:hypothetical protein